MTLVLAEINNLLRSDPKVREGAFVARGCKEIPDTTGKFGVRGDSFCAKGTLPVMPAG